MEQIKRSWYRAKLYKNNAVADLLSKYTLLDYGFELTDSYVHVKWFDGEQVSQYNSLQSWNIVTTNILKR